MNSSKRHLLLVCCVLAGALSRADDAPLNNEKPAVLPVVTISEKTTRRKVYDAKVENLWDEKRKKKTISYVEVLTAAYDTTKFDLIKCLLEKKAYREGVAKNHPFFCNYGAANIDVPIHWETGRMKMKPGRLKTGEGTTIKGVGFDYTTRVITLSSDAPLPFLLHASGTALSGFPSKKTAEQMKELVAKNDNKLITDHVEFELKLQDLNRYYATFTGTPIMTPLDAVHALAMFGHMPNKKIVVKVLERYGVVASEAQISAALVSEKVRRDGKTSTFELAYRLVDGVSAQGKDDTVVDADTATPTGEITRFQVEDGLNQKSRAEYEAMLESIIIEAPGHI